MKNPIELKTERGKSKYILETQDHNSNMINDNSERENYYFKI
jgi:hypothetical protein